MKILLVQKILRFAGSEIYLLKLLPGLRQQGIDAHFALLCDDFSAEVTIRYKSELTGAEVPVFLFKVDRVPTYRQIKAINRHLLNENYSLVHTHLLFSDMVFALIKTFFFSRFILVSTKHGYKESYNNQYGFQVVPQTTDAYRILSKVTEYKINRSFAVSKALKALYVGLTICSDDRLDVIYHGFDYEDLLPDLAHRFAPLQIVILGRLTAFKGHRFAILAMEKVWIHFPQAKLLIVGEGPEEVKLKKLAESVSLQEQIVFTGYQPNPRAYIAASDIFLLPSVAEAFGLVLLEAMATKIPIVAFNVPTPGEILAHNETALLAEPFSTEELADNLIVLLKDIQLREQIANAAYDLQKEKFVLERMVNDTIAFYKRALAGVKPDFIT